MKLFRLRFILLGLLLCVFHVWCRTCGTEFADPGSSAYLAKVVILGVVSQDIPQSGKRYNTTVHFEAKNIKKGKELLKKGMKTTSLTIGEFGPKDLDDCVDEIKKDVNYYFFLNVTGDSSFFHLSALPVRDDIPKKIKREIDKLSQCKMDDAKCVTVPAMKTKMKDTVLEENKQLQLHCNLKKAPLPKAEIIWLKDGVVIKAKKEKVQIKHGKKGSRLRIQQVSIADEGKYSCVVKSAAGSVQQDAMIKIVRKNTTPKAQARKRPCGKDKEFYCNNNGTCYILSELDTAYCECQLGYTGTRCGELIPPIPSSTDLNQIIDMIRNIDKSNHERTLIIISIIVGILAFIGLCVASYFLVKRRNKLFYRRQGEKRLNIEDNIPQVYRPLLSGCDEVDGPRPNVKASSCNSRGTQTIESSFSCSNGNLYVNPHDDLLRISSTNSKNKLNRKNRLTAESYDSSPSRPVTGYGRVTCNSDNYPRLNSENKSKDGDQNSRHISDNMAKEVDKERYLVVVPPCTSREGNIKGKDVSMKLSENQEIKENVPLPSATLDKKESIEPVPSPVQPFSAVDKADIELHSSAANISVDSSCKFTLDTESDNDEAGAQIETSLTPLVISEEDIATEDDAVENEQSSIIAFSDSCRSLIDNLNDRIKSNDSQNKNQSMHINSPLKYRVLDPCSDSSHFWNENGSLEQGMESTGLAYCQEKQCKCNQKETEHIKSALPFSNNNYGEGVKT